jgi:hypothetical protein
VGGLITTSQAFCLVGRSWSAQPREAETHSTPIVHAGALGVGRSRIQWSSPGQVDHCRSLIEDMKT